MADNKPVVDSINDAFNAKYQINGITYASNIDTINKRDAAGNIEYQQGEQDTLLVIETIAENIVNQSVLKVVDTQFNYFKFPATTAIETEDDFNLGIDPSEFAAAVEETSQPDELPTKYRPSADQEITKTASTGSFVSLEFSTVVEGQAQAETNRFTITQTVIDDVEKADKQRLRVEGVFTTFYSANLDSELEFVMKFLRNGTENEYRNSFSSPSEGPKIDWRGNVSKEGVYTTKMNFTISLIDLQASLGSLLYIQARTDRQSDKRYHVLKALDSYITFTAE